MHVSAMLSRILLAAAPLAGKRPDLTTIPGHKNLVDFTAQHAAAMTELCYIKSVKGPVQSRWPKLQQDHGHGVRPWTWCKLQQDHGHDVSCSKTMDIWCKTMDMV